MGILVTLFWIAAAIFVVWRIWARYHEAPPFDPDNPPDLRNFTPPSKAESAESSEDERRER